MSSVGQAVGMVVGAVIGAFIPGGYIMLGAAIGGMIGAAIDPPKGPDITGPRISDLSVQTATYGAIIPRIYGTIATFGNIFWVENNQIKEVEKKEDAGGKGGGGQEITSYEYYATFAVGICEWAVAGLRRIWDGPKLIFDAGDSSLGAVMSSAEMMQTVVTGVFTKELDGFQGNQFSIYLGSADQLPDDRMQATLGVANTPAYRGLCYIVFKDWPLKDYGNTLMGCQVKVEVITSASSTQYNQAFFKDVIFPAFNQGSGYGPFDPKLIAGTVSVSNTTATLTMDMDGNLLPPVTSCIGTTFYVGTAGANVLTYKNEVGPGGGYLYVGDTSLPVNRWKARDGNVVNTLCGAYVVDDKIYLLMSTNSVGTFEIYDENLQLLSSNPQSINVDNSVLSLPRLPGTSYGTFCVEKGGGYLYWFIYYLQTSSCFFYKISPSGALTYRAEVATAGEGMLGVGGSKACAAAENGLAWLVSNGGALSIFNRNPLVTSTSVELGDIISAECLSSGLLSAGDIDVTALTQAVRGYRVATTGAIRAAIDPLQAAWPFDVFQDGYKIKFIMRGGTSVATVAYDELGAVVGNDDAEVRIKMSREMDSQLPRKVTVSFIDANKEYDPGSGPGAERLNTLAVNHLHSELPIVLVADEAAQIEERLLYLYWLERTEFSFVLPPTYVNLQPADVVTITGSSATYSVRLTSINALPDGRMECTGRMNNAAVYSPTAVGEDSLSTGQVLTYPGGAVAALLDIPCVDSSYMNQSGFTAAMDGYLSGWEGGTLVRSADNGQTWNSLQSFLPPGCTIGVTTNSIGTGPTHVLDESSLLSVRLFSGELFSVTHTALYNGSNHFAYGAHGRWEIIAARTCTANVDETYTLSGLMRGRFGTERNMQNHATGDTLVWLSPATVRFIGVGVETLNLSRLYRAVSKGQSLDQAGNISFTYAGENLECLPPVYAKASKSAANDWTINWTRRTRTPTEPFSGVAAPLAESSEAYEVEIYSDSTYTTLKRTITGLTSAAATYTSAQQTTDFGAVQKYLYVKIYQLSANVGRGYPLTSLIGPESLINIKSLIHFDEASGTTIIDKAGNTVTKVGTVDTIANAPSFGGRCLQANASSGYIDLPVIPLTETKWTIECWVTPDAFSSNTYSGIFEYGGAADGVGGLCAFFRFDGLVCCSFVYGIFMYGPVTAAIGERIHMFVMRDGNNFYIGAKGYVGTSMTLAQTTFVGNKAFRLGYANVTYGQQKACKIDEWRVYANEARYPTSGTYNIPTNAFPDP